MRTALALLLVGLVAPACRRYPTPPVIKKPLPPNPCQLPGAWVHDASGFHANPGGGIPPISQNVPTDGGVPNYSWLTLPEGFCIHPYAFVWNVRQIRFAPGGELFASSPSTPVASGVRDGLGQILVIPDDDGDGMGDAVEVFNGSTASTQGLLFANEAFYFQDGTSIKREPYVSGQRTDSGQSAVVATISLYSSTTHWPKTLDIADDGTIYVGNGGDQGETCAQPMPFHGGILALDGTPGGAPVAMGLRNPIDIKCHHDGNNHCFATELGKDGSAGEGGREKLIPIQPSDNWGFPCCSTTGRPFSGTDVLCTDGGRSCAPDCSTITPETNSFLIGNTPFGFDFEDTQFPAPWDHHVLMALHGAVGSWAGARVVAVEMDADTGLPLVSTTTDGGNDSGAVSDFATGWDDHLYNHGRPADVAFSADGRMFVANDVTGGIFWVAPITQTQLSDRLPDGG